MDRPVIAPPPSALESNPNLTEAPQTLLLPLPGRRTEISGPPEVASNNIAARSPLYIPAKGQPRRTTNQPRQCNCWPCCIRCCRCCLCIDVCQEIRHDGTCCGVSWWIYPPLILFLVVFYTSHLLWTLSPQMWNFPQCPARVSPRQIPLFDTDVYYKQFKYTAWNESAIWTNEELCGEGFQGNPDAYGLGVRIGLYLQRFSSIIANQTSSETRAVLSQSYIIFLLAITIAILVLTAQNQCVFAIEMVIMYIMFFGGYFSVFFQPNLVKKEESPKWLAMRWTTAVIKILYALVIGHGSWFWIYGYDKHFATCLAELQTSYSSPSRTTALVSCAPFSR